MNKVNVLPDYTQIKKLLEIEILKNPDGLWRALKPLTS